MAEKGEKYYAALRKHLATQSQVRNLADNGIETLADFMRHSKDIHSVFYQLPSDVLQISKILIAMENGSIKSLGRKTLNDSYTIHIYILCSISPMLFCTNAEFMMREHQDLLIAELKSNGNTSHKYLTHMI